MIFQPGHIATNLTLPHKNNGPHRKSKRNFSKSGLWLNGDQKHFPYDFNKHECKDAFYTNFAINFLENKNTDKPFSCLCHIEHHTLLKDQLEIL